MFTREAEFRRGWEALRRELAAALLLPAPAPATAGEVLLSVSTGSTGPAGSHGPSGPVGSGAPAPEAGGDGPDADRLVALVDLARGGDAEAFGQLYDHYHRSVYRFVYYRVRSVGVAEDLTSETFFRALRAMSSFRWQGRDFGAWLMTIARNLTTDHFKAGRTRLETTTDDVAVLDGTTGGDGDPDGPEARALSSLTNEALLRALTALPHEQQECLVMRFLQGLTIAETAQVLGRSPGAVKQLQLRAVRALAASLPEDLR